MKNEDIFKRILNIQFNQTNSTLSISTTKGFKVLNIDDFSVVVSREDDPKFFGGFSIVRPVFSTPFYCLVGSSANSRYPLNTVYFWDEHLSQMISEVHFRSEVKNVLIRKDRAVIILPTITYIYMLNSLKAVSFIETCNNDRGAGAVSYDKDINVLLTLTTEPGSIRMQNFNTEEVKTAQIHENPITIISINFSGKLGASASEQGTIIRVFDCSSLEIIHELRRGTSPAVISSICFSPSGGLMAVTSNKSTMHVWKLEGKKAGGMFTSFLPGYFQYSRSVGKVNLKSEIEWTCPLTFDIGPKSVFLAEDTICIACLDGNLHRFQIDPTNFGIALQSTRLFFELGNENLVF